MEELWIPIVAIVAPAAVIAFAFWLRFRTREGMQTTFRLALDKGVELSPELIDRLGHPKPPKDKDLRCRLPPGWPCAASRFRTQVAMPCAVVSRARHSRSRLALRI